MNGFPRSVCATALLVFVGLTSYPATAQQTVQPPRQDCQIAAGIQPNPGSPQDQSCNTVFRDPDLIAAPLSEKIQVLRDRAFNMPDGAFQRVDLGTHLDYLTSSASASNNCNPVNVIPLTGAMITAQIGFNPLGAGEEIRATYCIESVPEGQRITITDTSVIAPNQIINSCFSGVFLIKNGGKNQTTVAVGDVRMWYNTGTGPKCGLVFTTDFPINVIELFYPVGPSGFFSTADITSACNNINRIPDSQQLPAAWIVGQSPETSSGIRGSTNFSACFGTALYCDPGEKSGLLNSCDAEQLPAVGAARGRVQLGRFNPLSVSPAQAALAEPAVSVLATTTTTGSDSTTTSSGDASSGTVSGTSSFCKTYPRLCK